MDTPAGVIARTYVKAWDHHVMGDGATAILAALSEAGFKIVRKEPPGYMNGQAKAAYRMNIQVGEA